jgi:hypothetical protein
MIKALVTLPLVSKIIGPDTASAGSWTGDDVDSKGRFSFDPTS